MRKTISLLLAVVLTLGLLPLGAGAAGSEQEALSEIDIYSGGTRMSYLVCNGRVQQLVYTYYNYTGSGGESREIPAYCVNPNKDGVPHVVGPGESVSYLVQGSMTDPKVLGILANGYPTRSLEELGLASKEDAFYATKIALWTYLLSHWSISGIQVNPALSGGEAQRAQQVLAAVKTIYAKGTAWNEVPATQGTCTPDRPTAYEAIVNGQSCKQQIFTVSSATWVNGPVSVSFTDPASVPQGTQIVDMNGQPITSLTLEDNGNGYNGQFKVLYPAASVEGQSGSVQLSLRAEVYQAAVLYAVCAQKDQYGDIQDYVVDTEPTTPVSVTAVSSYADQPDLDLETGLRILKYETGTTLPLEGAGFFVTGPDGEPVGTFYSNADGEVLIPLTLSGLYTITEESSPRYHLLPEERTQQVTVRYGEIAEVVFFNDPYGSLSVRKNSDTGQLLPGVTVQIRHIESGQTYTKVTGPGGVAFFDRLEPGAWEVRETAGIPGWQADTETVQTVNVVSGETAEISITNKELPGLRVVKYDRSDMLLMPDVTFAVYRDGDFLGNFQTDQQGEILITDAESGTYRVFEVDTGDGDHILDTTPQEIELEAGDGIRELVFFNDLKPGIHLTKVDSGDLSKPIANAKFLFEAVDGSWSQELTTLEDGTIDLSQLPTGAVVVTELSCPGYVIDDAQRIIQLDPNEDAEFVFTNSKLPSLTLTKTSSDGTPLAGVTYRLAKIEDGSRYLDRTTSSTGEIVWEGLEPGVYSLFETSTASDHILDTREYHVELFPGRDSTISLQNDKRSDLYIHKSDAATGAGIPGTVYLVKGADGHSIAEVETGPDGVAVVENLLPGVVEIIEKSVPEPYLLAEESQLVTLFPNRDRHVYFENDKRPSVEILKVNGSGEPIADVPFQIWYASNSTETGEYNDLGIFYTDVEGRILLTDPDLFLRDGWFRVREVSPAPGYALADPDTQEAFIPAGGSHTFRFVNYPLGNLIIHKLSSDDRKTPLEGVQFKITYADGSFVDDENGQLSSNGLYWTNSEGQIILSGITGTLVVTEVQSIPGYTIDPDTRTQTVVVREDDTQQLWFYNDPVGGVELTKVNEADKTEAIPDATFQIRRVSDDALVDAVTTGQDGKAYLPLEVGNYYAVETDCPDTFQLDPAPIYFTVESGRTTQLTVTNAPKSGILLHKISTADGEGIPGVSFILYDSGHNPIDQQTTDDRGCAWFEGLTESGRYYLRELENEGYIPDTQLRTVYVKAGETTLVEWENTPITGQIQIIKKSADYNPTTGLPAGILLEGAVFEIYDRAGNLVDTIKSDSRGLAVSKPLPLSRYTIWEVKAPDHYGVNETELTAYLEYEGQIVRFEVTNRSLSTGVSISKTGPKEVVSGQPVRYTFSGIANTSNVRLDSFFWRDTLPAQVRLEQVVTGTYNSPGTYKIVYKVNGTGDYRTLADNLSTSQNYVLDASPTALGLAANERVSEIMFVFGQAPAGFAQVEAPMLRCTAVNGLTAGSSFVNIADAGGVYNGQWVQAVTRWVTTVYGKPEPLPRTGY